MSVPTKARPKPPDPVPARVIVEDLRPEVDGGRFPVKRTMGERVRATVHVYADGHEEIQAALLHRPEGEEEWREVRLVHVGNDVWEGAFDVEALGTWRYTAEAWLDRFGTWRHGLAKKAEAGQDVSVDLRVGAALVEEAAGRAAGPEARLLEASAALLRGEGTSGPREAVERALESGLAQLMARHQDRRGAVRYPRELGVSVERERARFSSWYEMFPRSTSPEPGRHGTFRDCEARLPYVAGMGFDVLYLPPIHPIGRSHRKGKNNATAAGPDDVGSPWAIGAKEGGFDAIHPLLGTLEDFRRLVARAGELGIEVALDLAFQCSPDHPWVKEHPQWFRWRPDGTVQYAENPPKKYEDIYPLEFENEDWRGLWEELRRVVLFWVGQGVKVFRVDNPHTKPFRFWEWLIAEVRREHPDVIFLSEAFTRPKVMYRLAKLGFSQSYNYFPWRNTKEELVAYFSESTRPPVADFLRANLWPNTPDILTEPLQHGGRPVFASRLALAATLGASYGIYGPAYELMESRPRTPGGEEYLDSEKYQVRHWDLARDDSLRDLAARLNRIRRENPALQGDRSLRFHAVDNDQLVAYSKRSDDLSNVVLVVVNLDPHHVQSGFVEFPVEELALDPRAPWQVHDLLSDARFFWHGSRNFVELDPRASPAHVFRVRRRLRSERDFDYFL